MNSLPLDSDLVSRLHHRAQQEGCSADDLLRQFLDAVPPTYSVSFPDHLFNTINEALMIYRDTGQFLNCNPVILNLLGYTRDELLDLRFADIVPPNFHTMMEANQEYLLAGETGISELELLCKDGRVIPVELNAHRIEYNGKPAIVATARDITERQQIKETLRQSEEKFRLIAENTSDGIMIIDAVTSTMVYASPGYNRMMGRDKDYSEPRDRSSIFETIHPDDRVAIFALIEAAMEEKLENLTYTFRVRHRDGHYIWREDHAHFRYDAKGVRLDTYVIARDVTERKMVEMALEASEKRFRQVVENISEMFGLQDALSGNILYVSPAYETIWGRTCQSLYESPESLIASIHSDDLARVQAAMQRLQENEPLDEEYRILRPDNTVRWVHTRTYPVLNPQGRVYRYAGVAEDITERKQAEMNLQANESRLRSLIDSQTTYVIRTDLFGNYTYVNQAFSHKFGWMIEDGSFIGTPSLDTIIADDHRKTVETIMACAQAPGMPVQVMLHKPSRDGGFFWTLWEFVGLTDWAGQISEFQCVGIDITELMKARDQLQLQEEALQATANAIVITSPDGVIEWVNPSFTTLTGYRLEEARNQKTNLLKSGIQDRGTYKSLWNTILAGASWQGRLVNRRKDGSLYTEEQTITPVRDKSGVIRHFIAIKQDVTAIEQAEQLRLEQERLTATLKKEHDHNLLIQRIIAALSHDLRTPLAVISTSKDILMNFYDRLSDEKRKEKLDAIGKQTLFAIELLEDTVHMARGNVEEMRFRAEAINLAALCQISINEIQQTSGSHHQMRFVTDGFITTASVDETLITRILLNLLSNAVKFSPTASEIRLELNRRDDWIVLKVIDSGMGISQTDLEHIFDPFFRSESVYHIKGTGLGLSIVKDCVERHGGTIRIDSQIGSGTTFTIEMPLIAPSQPE